MVEKTGARTIANPSRRNFLAAAAAGLGGLSIAQTASARPDIVRTDFSTLPPYGNGTIPPVSARASSATSTA